MSIRNSIARVDSWRRTDEGYLDATVYPTKIGVFQYVDASGAVVRELRPAEEVFSPESLRSLENKPHTLGHPPELVNSRNAKKYKTGHVYGRHAPDSDGIHTRARVLVTDEEAISAIESGKVQVSCGYTCDLDDTPGVWNGIEYDRIQRNIRYNHLASVDRARLGEDVRIVLDGFDACEIDPSSNTENFEQKLYNIDGGDDKMSENQTIQLDGQNLQLSNDAAAIVRSAFDALQARYDELQARYLDLQKKYDEATSVDIDKLVNQRIQLIENAKKLNHSAKYDGLDDVGIMKMALGNDFEGKSEDYIRARFDAALELASERTAAQDAISRMDTASHTDDPIEIIRQKQIAEMYRGVLTNAN